MKCFLQLFLFFFFILFQLYKRFFKKIVAFKMLFFKCIDGFFFLIKCNPKVHFSRKKNNNYRHSALLKCYNTVKIEEFFLGLFFFFFICSIVHLYPGKKKSSITVYVNLFTDLKCNCIHQLLRWARLKCLVNKNQLSLQSTITLGHCSDQNMILSSEILLLLFFAFFGRL